MLSIINVQNFIVLPFGRKVGVGMEWGAGGERGGCEGDKTKNSDKMVKGREGVQKIPFLNVPTINYITINKKSTYVSPERGDNSKLRNFFHNFYNLRRALV